jgi:hypothetical protein
MLKGQSQFMSKSFVNKSCRLFVSCLHNARICLTLSIYNNSSCPKLTEDEAQIFHYLVAKLLCLCKREHPDIQTAIEFLSTRVKDPDGDDLKKLGCVIKYL